MAQDNTLQLAQYFVEDWPETDPSPRPSPLRRGEGEAVEVRSNFGGSEAPTVFPTRKRATSSIGFWVADKPILWSGAFVNAARRSILKARCDPRRFPTTAWISSTIRVRTVRSSRRPDSEVKSR